MPQRNDLTGPALAGCSALLRHFLPMLHHFLYHCSLCGESSALRMPGRVECFRCVLWAALDQGGELLGGGGDLEQPRG